MAHPVCPLHNNSLDLRWRGAEIKWRNVKKKKNDAKRKIVCFQFQRAIEQNLASKLETYTAL